MTECASEVNEGDLCLSRLQGLNLAKPGTDFNGHQTMSLLIYTGVPKLVIKGTREAVNVVFMRKRVIWLYISINFLNHLSNS